MDTETEVKPSRSTGRQRETVTAKVVGVVDVSVCSEGEPAGLLTVQIQNKENYEGDTQGFWPEHLSMYILVSLEGSMVSLV